MVHYKVNGGDTIGQGLCTWTWWPPVIWDHLRAYSMDGKIACANDPEACFGDLNSDGSINVADVLSVLSNFGCTLDCVADVNSDGAVNVSDILGLLGVFGVDC